jgi:lysophospholipase L1-like esterase
MAESSCRALKKEGIAVELVENPSVTGWTTQQAIDYELPVLEKSNPTFVTLLLGVNDWVQGVDEKTFENRLQLLLDRIQTFLPNKKQILLVTIPDFSATPTGARYANGRDISAGIRVFNEIIKREGEKRGLPVADIYPISQDMKGKSDLVVADGLHPSGKEYALWEEKIFPTALALLSGMEMK